jgi:hypothetical protein
MARDLIRRTLYNVGEGIVRRLVVWPSHRSTYLSTIRSSSGCTYRSHQIVT